MPTPTSISLSLTFNLGARKFHVWANPLETHHLTIQEINTRELPTYKMGFPRAWAGYEMEQLIRQAVTVITNRDHVMMKLANANPKQVHLVVPRRASAASRCPTCQGYAKGYRLEHGVSCPTCGGTGNKPTAKPTPTAKPPAHKRKHAELSLADIGL